jgi:hypothetical protein
MTNTKNWKSQICKKRSMFLTSDKKCGKPHLTQLQFLTHLNYLNIKLQFILNNFDKIPGHMSSMMELYSGCSTDPMTNQMQAIQWANRANVIMSNVSMTTLYWEYLKKLTIKLMTQKRRSLMTEYVKFL